MEFPIKEFNIFNIIKYNNFEQLSIPFNGGSYDIVCYGTCDLFSIRPIGIKKYYWAEYLDQRVFFKGTIFPSTLQEVQISHILNNTSGVKYLCYTLGIYGIPYILNNNVIGITKNSSRVIRFLHKKNILNDIQYQSLQQTISDIANTDIEKILEYYNNHISTISKLCSSKDIKLLWTFNGTKTANDFFRPIESEIVSKNKHNGLYVGWVENIDTQIEGSMGYLSHIEMSKKFTKNII